MNFYRPVQRHNYESSILFHHGRGIGGRLHLVLQSWVSFLRVPFERLSGKERELLTLKNYYALSSGYILTPVGMEYNKPQLKELHTCQQFHQPTITRLLEWEFLHGIW
jgi:hypothetical protein